MRLKRNREELKNLNPKRRSLREMAKLRSTKELDGIPQKLNLMPLPEGELSAIQVVDKAAALAATNEDKEARNPKR